VPNLLKQTVLPTTAVLSTLTQPGRSLLTIEELLLASSTFARDG
jgi:hypothetical protein